MKVLITGHKGFIGRHVFADWRRELGYAHVRGIDHPDCVSSFKGGDFDLVIHLAAWADIRESIASPDAYYINNVVKAKPLLIGVEKQILDYYMHHQVLLMVIIGRTHML